MAEYIDKKLLIEVLKNREECRDCIDTDCVDCICDFIACIVPSDVTEVKHGKWNESYAVGFSGTKYYMYNCSVCGCLAIDESNEKYCHNCGAKMDGGNEE